MTATMMAGTQARFLPFVGVGAIGFVIDAGLLTLLVNGFAWGHYSARAISFACAVTVTWACNRHWVFERTNDLAKEYRQYFSVQIIGACLNLGTYVLLIESFPPLGRWPIVPLAIGGIVGLVFNFNAAKRIVFAPAVPPPASTTSYAGRDNLEAMLEARNYNAFLSRLVETHCGTGRILDFGAGIGTFARPLTSAGHDVLCVEPDPDLRAALDKQGLRTAAALDDVRPESVDHVYTLNVLEHIENDVAALAMLLVKLTRGGTLLVYVPAFPVLFSAMDRRVGHFRRYRKEELQAKLAGAGFSVDATRYVDSLGFAATLAYKLVGDGSGALSPRSVALYDRCLFPISRLLDRILGGLLGKNLVAVAHRPHAQ